MPHTVYEGVAAVVAELHDGPVFGLMGDVNLKFVTRMKRSYGMPYYAARHESGAVAMADAWARVTGSSRGVFGHPGPRADHRTLRCRKALRVLAEHIGALTATSAQAKDQAPDGPYLIDCKVDPAIMAPWFSEVSLRKNNRHPVRAASPGGKGRVLVASMRGAPRTRHMDLVST